VIGRLARAVGLVPRGELRRAEEKLVAMRQRLDKTTERLTQTAAASDALRQTRREDAQRYKTRLADLESELARHTARAAGAADRTSRHVAAIEEGLRARDAELRAAVREETRLEQQVAAAMQELQAAREALALVEVKLDILEGAAHVLDSRTRAGRSMG